MRNILFISLLIALLLVNCTQNKNSTSLSKREMINIIAGSRIPHLQSKEQKNLFKKQRIKSVSVIQETVSTGEVDSVTFLRYDKEGRIKSRTTSECTTIGCLPYITYQLYVYSKGKPKQMIDYTFKKKYKWVSSYWKTTDTNKLSKFDWEDYKYHNDSVTVTSATQIWNYIKNSEGQIIYDSLFIKIANQFRTIKYIYSDSNFVLLLNSNNVRANTEYGQYNFKDKNTIVYTSNINPNKILRVEYKFNNNGLLTEINSFENKMAKMKYFIYYSYY